MKKVFALAERKSSFDQRKRPGSPEADLPAAASRSLLSASGQSETAGVDEIERLYAALGGISRDRNPRTLKLLESGTRKVAQKVIEEAGEVAIEAVRHDGSGVVRESADLLYHLIVLWCRAGVEPKDVWNEMKARAARLGIAEKPPKSPSRADQDSLASGSKDR